MTDDLAPWLRQQLDDEERDARGLTTWPGVYARTQADRRILDLHDRDHECSVYTSHQGTPEVDNCAWVLKGEACSTVRLLALPRADRPGYRHEWRPA